MHRNLQFKFWLGIAVSVFFMVLLFRKMDFRLLWQTLLGVDYGFVLLGVLFTFTSYFLRAVRWQYLLITVRKIPISSLLPATLIGYMANNILPARLGEFVRAYVLAQREKLETPAVFASLVVDRLYDGFTVLMLLLLTLFTLELPEGAGETGTALRVGGLLTFVVYIFAVVFLLLLKIHTSRTLCFVGKLCKPFPANLTKRLIALLESFIAGIVISAKKEHIFALICSSALIWLFALLPVDMVLQGFGIHLPMAASMFVLVLLVFAVMVPASPGFIGTYHYACYKGLTAFGVDPSTSVSLALVIHGMAFFPVILAGFFCLWQGGISLSKVRQASEVTQ